jgi:uncharacterized glyoxalase superfamily metalloenzyme YdcJ
VLDIGHGRRLSQEQPLMTGIQTWQLRAKFAAALSAMYGAEVPAYTTLVEALAQEKPA